MSMLLRETPEKGSLHSCHTMHARNNHRDEDAKYSEIVVSIFIRKFCDLNVAQGIPASGSIVQ